MDVIRVLRVIEYVGPRDEVEEQVRHSIQGERRIRNIRIRAGTIGDYPEILDNVTPCAAPPGMPVPYMGDTVGGKVVGCTCDYPTTRYRNGSGHVPTCPVHARLKDRGISQG